LRDDRHPETRSTWKRVPVWVLMLISVLPMQAAERFPVGLQPEPWAGLLLLKLALLALGVCLLAVGGRFPRFTMGVFLSGLLALAVFRPLGAVAYGVALAVLVLLFGVLYLVYLVVPRLVTAVSMVWVLPALYLLYMNETGSFSWNRWLVLVAVLAGAALGAAFPRLATILLSVGLGLAFLAGSPVGPLSFPMVLVVGAGALAIQLLDFFVVRKAHAEPGLRWSDVRDDWGRRLARAAGTVAAAAGGMMWYLSLAAPMVAPTDPVHLARISRLAEQGGLSGPGILVSAEDGFYLSGRRFPVMVLSPRQDLLDRLLLPVVGKDPSRSIHRLRTVKDETELAAMRKAMAITSEAMRRVGEAVRPGIREADLAAIVEQTFREMGAEGYAFPSIVGAGSHACLPHYDANNGILSEGFVVVDIGCMVDGYCADMTRTFPVKRAYTPAQKELIELVRQAKHAAVAELKPGVSYRVPSKAAKQVFEAADLAAYYLHSLGHHVGINVHDPHADKMAPGMVVTVEPGLYIAADSHTDRKYWNLGVRIEDSYLITESGCELLTHYPEIPFLPETGPGDTVGPDTGEQHD